MYASASLVWWLPARSSCSTAEPAVNSGHDRKLRAAADVTAIRPFQATGWPGRETTTLAGVVGFTAPASRPADKEAAPIFVTNIPVGYRDWRFISVAREEGSLNDIRAILGNDKAIKAYRDGKLPFPDGTIIARLAWSYDSSEENNKVFGSPQSFVAGQRSPVYGQGLTKIRDDWRLGYAQFDDGKPADETKLKTCYPCHQAIKARDFVFTRYAP